MSTMPNHLQAYTLLDIQRLCHREKVKKRWWYHIHRRLSTPFTWVAYRVGFSPNTISASMVLVGLLGNLALVPLNLALNLLGLMLVYLAFLLDKVDGDLARLQDQAGPRAMILDYAYHRLTLFTFYAALGAHAYLIDSQVMGLVAGFVAGFLANYALDAQLYPYRIYAQKVVCGHEGWTIAPPPARRAGEQRDSWWKILKIFTSQLLLLVPSTVLVCWQPTWLMIFLFAAAGDLVVFLAVQHYVFLRGGMEAELAYIDRCVRQGSPDPRYEPNLVENGNLAARWR
ncbi:MAG: hypothetical protein HY288_19570 [Planctomycetia bacterium]|nr:hypothetical protein [Planctomycetia bacterium]